MAEAELFEGGCLCGAVRYHAAARPLRGVICHCSICRRHSGAPTLAFVHFPAAALRVAWFEIADDLPRFSRSHSAVPSKALEP